MRAQEPRASAHKRMTHVFANIKPYPLKQMIPRSFESREGSWTFSTVESLFLLLLYLMILTGDASMELFVLTDQDHLLKSEQHSMCQTCISRFVQHWLTCMGYRNKRPTRMLTAWHRIQCLSWTCEVANWSLVDWEHATWSDESRCRADGRVRVRRKPKETVNSWQQADL